MLELVIERRIFACIDEFDRIELLHSPPFTLPTTLLYDIHQMARQLPLLALLQEPHCATLKRAHDMTHVFVARIHDYRHVREKFRHFLDHMIP